jgi:4-amino-4-deoxy-L-arabinose transferase-like glycosyltransferase
LTDISQSATLPVDTDPPAQASKPKSLLWRVRALLRTKLGHDLGEVAILLGFAGYFLFYGLVPYFGGDQLGLVGADEPRYAQIAREMLHAHNERCNEVHAMVVPKGLTPSDIKASYTCLTAGTITPILYGRPWLEKPALYYWRTMSFYKEFGVSDWSARIASATGALALIILAFLHLRRFRPGGHLDAALIMVSCVAIVSFARGASTDMQLAAPFCIGMLGWYAWYETGKKFWLFDLYFFGAAATLAKGPVAPFMALAIICLFLGLRKEWSALRRTIWIPGVLLYLAMVLPWYLAVQRRNPTFFYEFFLQHNVERFATDLYRHHQPAYYYLIVLIIGLLPWTALSLRALVDGLQISLAEWAVRFKPQRYLGHVRAGDAFPEFLVLWALFPIIFFSFSGSKLPGYILPAIPPLAILTGDYLFRIRRVGLPTWLLNTHAVLAGIVTFVLILCPQYMVYQRIIPAPRIFVWAAILGIASALAVIFAVRRWGVKGIRLATLLPLAALLFFLLGIKGYLLDLNYSARPLARLIQQKAPDVPTVAQLDVRRDLVYGLAFYRNQEVEDYVTDGVPNGAHILVFPTNEAQRVQNLLQGRLYQSIDLYETRGLSVYKVYPKS